MPGDTNAQIDAFVHDRQTGITERVSVAADGAQASNNGRSPSISADGRYVAFYSDAFNLVPGDTNARYDIFVAVNLPAWQAATVTANVGAGESVAAVDLASRPLPGEIHGRKFEDHDRDGLGDSGEPGLGGWTIYLDLNSNGRLDAGEPSTLTDSRGQYSFTDLEPFTTYTVAEVPQQYWVQTYPALVDDGIWTVQVGAGDLVTDVDFGNYYNGPGGQNVDVITGTFFQDLNLNGRQDGGEQGLGNWQVFLDENDDGVLDAAERTATTDAAGGYTFTGVVPNSYSVRAVPQTDWRLTTPLENSLDATPFGEGQFDQTQAVATGDFDGDGDLDLAVADLLDGDVSILRNTNGSFIRLPESLSAGKGPQTLIAADLEGDGYVDLIVTNNTAEHLGILRNLTNPMSGKIEFAPLESHGVADFDGGPAHSAVAGHFDTDLTLDLAVAIGETSLRIGVGR